MAGLLPYPTTVSAGDLYSVLVAVIPDRRMSRDQGDREADEENLLVVRSIADYMLALSLSNWERKEHIR
jgi:hypothetical protein